MPLGASMQVPWRQSHPLFLGRDYWVSRLAKMRSEPRHLTQLQRRDLARPGAEVLELNLKSHDGAPIQALLARSTFHRIGRAVHLRTCCGLDTCAIDWKAVEEGTCDLVFPFPSDRPLEARVLDVLRMVQVAADLESVRAGEVQLFHGARTAPDEYLIAELVLEQGW